MASSSADVNSPNGNDLRKRLPKNPAIPQKADSVDAARQAVMEMNLEEEHADKDEKEKRTYGRTPDGTSTPSNDLVFAAMLGYMFASLL